MLLVPRIAPHTWLPLVVCCGLAAGGLWPGAEWVGSLGGFSVSLAALPVTALLFAVWRVRSAHSGPAPNYRARINPRARKRRRGGQRLSLRPLIGSVFMALAAFTLGLAHSGGAPAPFGQEPREQVIQGSVARTLNGSVLVCRTQGMLSMRPSACVLARIPASIQPFVGTSTTPSTSSGRSARSAPRMAAGDRVTVRGRLRPPSPPLNPFDFNEQRWMQSLGAVAILDHVTALHRQPGGGMLPSLQSVRSLESVQSTLRAHRQRLRRGVSDRFDARLATPLARALARALWLGDRSAIPEDVQAAFAASGLAHLLAVSGLHVGFVALALLAALRVPFRRLPVAERRRRQLAGLTAAAGLVLFGWWIGPAASVERAVIMGSALLLSGVFVRKPSPWVAFWWAMLLSLWMAPTAWQAVGWQLSFSAVGAILVTLPWLSRLRRQPAASALVVTAAAWLGTAPVLVLSFGQSPLAGAALSPIAVPLMAPLLLTTLASLVDPGPVSILLTEALVAALYALARFGAAWPEWTLWSAPPGTASPLLILPWLLIWMLRPGPPRSRTRRSAIGAWTAAVLVLISPPFQPPIVQQLHVGQGDATTILLPGTSLGPAQTIVIDSGPSDWSGGIVASHVSGWGRRRIDWLIHSHEHADHTGGTRRLAHLLPVKRFASQHSLRRGDTLDVGPAARLYVLGPARHPVIDPNNDSVVLRLQVGPRSWLFMGDAEAAAERALVRHMGPFLDVDVVKVGHHGSATSSTGALTEWTTAETALISAGRDNRFSHPDSAVVERWKRSGARVHVTFRDGAWSGS